MHTLVAIVNNTLVFLRTTNWPYCAINKSPTIVECWTFPVYGLGILFQFVRLQPWLVKGSQKMSKSCWNVPHYFSHDLRHFRNRSSELGNEIAVSAWVSKSSKQKTQWLDIISSCSIWTYKFWRQSKCTSKSWNVFLFKTKLRQTLILWNIC